MHEYMILYRGDLKEDYFLDLTTFRAKTTDGGTDSATEGEKERIDPYLCTCICVTDRHVHCAIDHCGMWTCLSFSTATAAH